MGEVAARSAATSPSSKREYGVQRAYDAWDVATTTACDLRNPAEAYGSQTLQR